MNNDKSFETKGQKDTNNTKKQNKTKSRNKLTFQAKQRHMGESSERQCPVDI